VENNNRIASMSVTHTLPRDYDNPAHLDALLRAYERLPEIGGRSAR
jgi:hypothetical protein